MQKKVLLLDDDLSVLEAVQDALVYYDYTVQAIPGAADIFSKISEFKPDLLLLDYLLMGENGGEVCHQIKNDPATAGLPVVFISAYSNSIPESHLQECDGVLEKPFDLTDLLEKVRQLV